jgi:hypothetical protein
MKTTTFISTFFLFCLTGFVNAQIKVFDGGKVSVGSTITPAWGCRLQVSGNSVFTEDASNIEFAAYIRGLNCRSSASNPDYTWYNNDNTGIFHPATNTICFTTNGAEAMRIVSNGNILIGHTSDWGEKLSVNAGNQRALLTSVNHNTDWNYSQVTYVNRQNSKALAVLYNTEEKFKVYGNGDVWAYGHYTGSDKLLKENITPITDALKKVMLINGVSYNYKPEVLKDPNDTITYISTDSPKTLIGLIAEDIEPIVPEVVKTFEDGLKGISYGNLVALLIEAIKEQEIHINTLEQTLAAYGNGQNSNQERLDDDNLKIGIQENQERILNHELNSQKPILYQNVPNPFNVKTKIQYFIPEDSFESSILIFDMQGTLLNTYELVTKGNSSLEISGGELKPGMYMYTLIYAGKEIDTRKMILTN